jgi:serine/threonine protein kinase
VLAEGLTVVEHLRRGQHLDVYDAWDASRDAPVVVKRLRPDVPPSSRAAKALRREGRLLARLAHPHLVRGYEVRETDHGPLVVLETLPGATLGALVDERVLSPDETAVLGQQLASAVGYLHRQELLHLDLKPSNVVATAGGVAKLLDLSIARKAGRVPAGYGTWSNMAPEQARGGAVGPAADVWGLGLVLHEAVTGEAAFDVAGEHHDFPQLHRRAPRARALRRSVPKALDELLTGALEPAAEDRPQLAEITAGLRSLA